MAIPFWCEPAGSDEPSTDRIANSRRLVGNAAERPDQPAPLTDREIADGLRVGDRDAMRELFGRYYPRLAHFAGRMLGDRDLGEEVAQEVFVNVWATRQSIRPADSLAPYLYRAVINQARHYTAAQRRQAVALRVVAEDPSTSSDIDDRLPRDDPSLVVARVRAIVDHLPEQPRRVFLLAHEQQLTHHQIAAVLEISVKTVSVHLSRALAAIRQQLGSNLDPS